MKKTNELIDVLTGREARMREIYMAAFSDGGADEAIGKAKKNNKTMFLALCLVLAAVAALWASEAMSPAEGTLDLTRDEPGGSARTVEAQAHASFGGSEIKQDVSLRVLPREPSVAEAEAAIEELKRRLPVEILGENESANAIWTKLNLPEYDEKTGAEITWRSADETLISDDGKVNTIGRVEGESVLLTAQIRFGEVKEDFSIALKIGMPPENYDFSSALRSRVAQIAKAAGRTDEGDALALPDGSDEGFSIDWSAPKKKGHIAEIMIVFALIALCFHYRFRSLEKRVSLAREQIEHDFPDFIGKLGLLLGAGLVITSAIERITEDYEKYRRGFGKRRLYEELVGMRERMKAGNTPLVYEFADVARRSGLREVMRFSSILADNIDKGSALAEKLEQEGAALWDARKRRAEKEGRVAETRLIFPMVLQVLVVVLITVTPAAFEMR